MFPYPIPHPNIRTITSYGHKLLNLYTSNERKMLTFLFLLKGTSHQKNMYFSGLNNGINTFKK